MKLVDDDLNSAREKGGQQVMLGNVSCGGVAVVER
jgi:hypothetical protein